MLNKLQNLMSSFSLSKRIFVLAVVSILVVYSVVALVIYLQTKSKIEDYNIEALKREVGLIKEQIAVFDEASKNSAEQFMKIFQSMVKGISPDNDTCDRFTSMTGGSVATIFEKKGDDFLRIATSLKKEDGSRAVGTTLDRGHPAYPLLLKGETYIGKATLFGKDYMTKYVPVKDGSGNVIGVYFVGFDITKTMKHFKDYIRSIKVGQTGYMYVLDDKGTLLVHPKLEGKNIIDSKDAKGREFIKEIIEKKEGIIYYPWKNPDETWAREKVVAYTHYPAWKWIIASGSYLEEITSEVEGVRNLMLFVNILGAIVVSFLILFVTQRSLKPVPDMAQKLEEVAKGDFSRVGFGKGYRNRKDEIGLIARSVIKVEEFTQKLIKDIKESVTTVNAVIGSLESNIETVKLKANEQASQAHQIATASEEMSQTITDIAKNAATASDLATESMKISNEGQLLADSAMNVVQSANRSTVELKKTIDALNSRVEEIGDIVTVIKDIADQTNLLALNAAIEAARAGEQGRGFAVVADEVRKLAERTIKATDEIANKITAVQAESHESIKSMDMTVHEVAEALKALNEVKKSLNKIAEHAQKVKDQITHIATATEEQSSASDEVASSAERSRQLSQEVKNTTDTVVQEVENLNSVINKLVEAVKGVKA
ncbi:methyl-accepting chemotaxis protein [Thermodesulfovibrio sp. 1176]|uniref:methyl-accepting chemotaxis protein n=1 Tax=Thermodesulfovibrio sp. 1176 TaxID=3043424 RepID=UPI002483181C|nr:methyl-accepting chemotaxis protein [Thermodesulfovibrio sp. 1176]MDI1471432.1 methyl-accepting chemotaxis protein [Thermodesulfovibrio sp. 1176]